MAAIEVFRSEYTTISMDPRGPLVRMVRSDLQFQSLDALERCVAEMIRTLDSIGRDGRVLFSDLRAVQGRNDPAFEERMAKLRPRLYEGFVRVGILVRSSVGALQIRRLVMQDGRACMVMTDEAALLEYLLYG
ncbi:MAG: hypothetical protein IPM54_32840 [Polyangiaceae bacterium]|nr:hypothetical protein [Polyangiaceae bacterium]